MGTNPRLAPISVRESQTMNPKRISIATSEFWKGHPDLGHFVSGWELGPREKIETSSVWGANEQGGTDSVNLWGDPPAVKKGILLLQRDKLWARWKERYCILTRDYLHCFRRTTSVHRSGVRLSEMGTFIFKLRLADIDTTEWESRKSGPMIAIHLPHESRLLIRAPCDTYEGLQEWHTLLQECVYLSKERRNALRSNHNMNTNSTHSKSTSTMSTTNSSASSSGTSVRTKNSQKSCNSSSGSDGSPNSTTKSSGSSGDYEKISRLPMPSTQSPVVLRVKERSDGPAVWRNSQHEALHNAKSRLSLSIGAGSGRVDSMVKMPQPQGRYNYIDFGDDDSDYDDAELADNFPVHTRQRCSRASIAVDGASYGQTERYEGPTMTLHDFVKNPWKNRNSIAAPTHDSHNFPNSQPRSRCSLALARQRPESWNPTTKIDLSNYFSPWDKSRNGNNNASDFRRNQDSIYSTSRHTSEITFRKMS